jgi:tripeptidyl-peptidase-1
VAPYSSGGFSEYFKAPSWQSSAIKDYFKKSGTQKSLKGLFNEAGRGFPDVSLMGTFYAVVQSGRKEQVWGTSCSTPVFAAMVALLNDKRLAAGKPILGYINPWLFKTGRKAFKPISKGWNSGCGTTFNCEPTNCLLKGKPLYGFPAVGSTWSPGVGLGSPSFAKLLELV